jgi:NADH-quinone oxidoreductase subunit M
MGWIFGLCIMASLGLPGLAGFWGEFPAILSAYSPANGVPVETFRTYMVIAALGTVLAAGYLLWLLQRAAFGTPSDEFADDPNITDTTRDEWIAWVPMLVLIVAIGVYPNLVFRLSDGAVDASLHQCLKVDASELTAAQVEALGCADVYKISVGTSAGHAAVGG